MKGKILHFLLLIFLISYIGCSGGSKSSSSKKSITTNKVLLLSPDNGAVNLIPRVVFKWDTESPMGYGYTFTLMVGENEDDLNLVFSNITAGVYEVNLKENTHYFWKVQLVKGKKVISESDVYSFTTRGKLKPLKLISPEDGATVESLVFFLKWDSVPQSSNETFIYRVFLGNSPETLYPIGETTSTFFRVHSLKYGVTYYWKVVAYDGNGDEISSTTWSFTTPFNPALIFPEKPELLAPLGRGRLNPTIFSWTSCDKCIYTLYLGVLPASLQPIATGIVGNSYSLYLEPGERYYWKVVAENSYGNKTTSEVGYFIVDRNPNIPILLSPVNGSTGVTAPILSWSDSDPDGDVLSYKVYFGTDPDSMIEIASGVTEEVYSLADYNLTPGIPYYWKIIAYDRWGGVANSVINSFYSDSPPENFHLLYPAGISGVSVVPLLKWSKSKDPDGGTIKYSVYFGICGAVRKIDETEEDSFYPGELSPNTTYCWQVIARDDAGLTVESYPATFTTGSGKIPKVKIAMGKYNTYYIDSDGKLYSAGKNSEGEVGNGVDGDPVLSLYPIAVSHSWEVVGSGSLHVCAVDSAGELYCWGWNAYGQLGNGTTKNSDIPVLVHNPEGKKWIYVDGGDQSSCGLDETGTIYCWGNNNHYQVGQEDNTAYYTTPQKVYSGRKFTMVSVGFYFACGLDGEHRIWCWGDNAYGQVPYPSAVSIPQEVTNPVGSKWVMVTSGFDHACAVDGDGDLWCWGRNNKGQLGIGSSVDKISAYYPVRVTIPGKEVRWKYVGAGGYTTCGITTDGQIWCWGQGDWGMLGNGDLINYSFPVKVFNPSGDKWFQVASGLYHTCGIRENGELWCWGLNAGKLIGDPSASGMLAVGHREGLRLTPERISDYVPYFKPARLLSSFKYVGAIDFSGDLYLWGFDMSLGHEDSDIFLNTLSASLGSPQIQLLPMKFRSIKASQSVLCGIGEDSSVYCWGHDKYNGTLGHSFDITESAKPLKVDVPGRVVSLYSGLDAFCALNEYGDLWCWGGIGDPTAGGGFKVTYPIKIPRVGGRWISAAIGVQHMCAIDDNYDLYCRGDNYYGELGIGYESDYEATPMKVDSNHHWKEVVALVSSTCAIDVDNNLFCWGSNSWGVLGIGNSNYEYKVSSPVQVSSPNTKWFTIRSNRWRDVCGIDINGVLYCWGDNEYGVIGDGTTDNATSPVAVFNGSVKFIDATVNKRNTCAIDRDYNLWCWGYDDVYFNYQYISVGDGSLFSMVPVRVNQK